MALQNDILVKITGETDLADAQLQLRELTSRSKELEQQMRQVAATEKEDEQSIRGLKLSQKELADALKRNKEYYAEQRKEIQKQIVANDKSALSLKRTVISINAMNGVGSKLTTQIRTLRDELSKMEMAGDTSSQAFIDLSVQTARLQDQMGDTQRQIMILASDTAKLDAAMSVGSGVAGAFNVATSAAALLGGESEALNQAFLKVQATMAILNGVQQVANVLNKDSAANVVIRTALQKLFNKTKVKETAATAAATTATAADTVAKGAQAVATKGATKATWSLNKAMLANPAMLIVAGIAALAAGLVYLFKSMDDTAERAERMNKSLEKSNQRVESLQKTTNAEIAIMQAEGKSEEEILAVKRKAAQERNKITSQTLAAINKEIRSGKSISDEMRETQKEAIKANDEAWEALNDITLEGIVLQRKRAKEAADEEAKRLEERKKAIADAQKQLKDVNIALMKDGADKEIAQINLNYDRKIEAITGNSSSEIALRKALEKQRHQEIMKVREDLAKKEIKQAEELEKLRLQNDVAMAEDIGGDYLYETKKETFEKIAQLERNAVQRSEESEQMKAERILAIDTKLTADLKKLEKDHGKEIIDQKRLQAENRLMEDENAAMKVLNNENSTDEEIMKAREQLNNHEANLRGIRLAALEDQKNRMLITEDEYNKQKLDIEGEALEEEREVLNERAEDLKEATNIILSGIGELANEIFGAIQDHIQNQLDELDEMYTTDAEEAKENSAKKYISEKELEDKKLALRRKAAAAEKAAAVFSIGLNTAMAIMQAIAQFGPPPSIPGIAGIAVATALGATQMAIALAKPLPKYAKGRKGGAGEYALVGERGPELMYVPDGASIVPNNKLAMPGEWINYGLPEVPHVVTPDFSDAMQMAIAAQLGIDYDRMGRAVANNMRFPKQKAVTVNVDRAGITVNEGGDEHTYLNQKYFGQWK